MRRLKIFCLLTTLIVVIAMLPSCRINRDDETKDGDDGINSALNSETGVNVIVPTDAGYSDSINDKIYNLYLKICNISEEANSKYWNDSRDESEHEIVVGETNRNISRLANEKLTENVERYLRYNSENAFVKYFGVYSYEGSWALVGYDEVALSYAIDYFAENYIDKSISCKDDYFDFQAFDYLESIRTEESAEREKELAEVEEMYGSDTVAALQNFLTLYDENFYLWLADLYEPGEYDENGNPIGGGFYYSNSARNTYGFEPDLESTYQVIDFILYQGKIFVNKKTATFKSYSKGQKELM